MRRVLGEKLPVPLSSAIQTETMVFVSGQVPTLDDGSIPSDFEAQTRLVLDKVKAFLEAGGSSLDKVVKTTVFLTNVEDFDALNRIYGEYFSENPPARSCIRSDLMVDVKVEIEAMALR